MAQSPTVDVPKRLPLVITPENRSDSTAKDAKLINCYVEKQHDGEYWIFKRAGTLQSTQPSGGAATGYGMYNWLGDIYTIFGNKLYKNNTAITGTVNVAGGVYQFSSCLGATPKLIFGNGIKGYTYDATNGLVEITSTGFPASFVKGWAFLNGTTYVMGASTATGFSLVYLIVGGGGGAGGGGSTTGTGGGGGAGGFRYITGGTLTSGTSYPVVVGAGGVGGTGAVGPANPGTSGGNSSFNGLTATGGGYGSGAAQGGAGGSGGGTGGGGGATGGVGTSGQGTNGAGAATTTGGGGGGATGVGSGTTGGAGTSNSISGAAVTYAGGGGSTSNNASGSGSGGAGGGGAGGNSTIVPGVGTAGTNGLGGGGGGGGNGVGTQPAGTGNGGNGGSGVVIISYSGAQSASGGTVTSVGGNTIHTFTSSGNLITY